MAQSQTFLQYLYKVMELRRILDGLDYLDTREVGRKEEVEIAFRPKRRELYVQAPIFCRVYEKIRQEDGA